MAGALREPAALHTGFACAVAFAPDRSLRAQRIFEESAAARVVRALLQRSYAEWEALMIRQVRLVSLNGSPRAPSRTESLVRALAIGIVEATGAKWRHYAITDIAPLVMPALTRDVLAPDGEAIIAEIEASDIVLLGTPVYRASFTGALKHVLDLVHWEALRGRIAVLAATGGNRHHGLVTEHQLRPLMSFFGMHTVPTTVYAEEADFDGYAVRSKSIHDRIQQVAAETARLIDSSAARSQGRQPAPMKEIVA